MDDIVSFNFDITFHVILRNSDSTNNMKAKHYRIRVMVGTIGETGSDCDKDKW